MSSDLDGSNKTHLDIKHQSVLSNMAVYQVSCQFVDCITFDKVTQRSLLQETVVRLLKKDSNLKTIRKKFALNYLAF